MFRQSTSTDRKPITHAIWSIKGIIAYMSTTKHNNLHEIPNAMHCRQQARRTFGLAQCFSYGQCYVIK